MSDLDIDDQIKDLANLLQEMKQKAAEDINNNFNYESEFTEIKNYTSQIYDIVKNMPPEQIESYQQEQDNPPSLPPVNNKEIKSLKILHRQEKIFGDAPIRAMCLLSDNRIAFGSLRGEIAIYQIDLIKQTAQEIMKPFNAHSDIIQSLSTTNNGDLISGSDDFKVKLWSIGKNNIFIKPGFSVNTNCHEDSITKVLGLKNGLIASSSNVQKEEQPSLILWNTKRELQSEYKDSKFSAFSMTEVKNKNRVLAVLSFGNNKKLCLFDSNNFTTPLATIKTLECTNRNALFALPNSHVAILRDQDMCIVEVNSSSINEKKIIKHEEINSNSTEVAFEMHPDEESFVFTVDKHLIQIESKGNFKILKCHKFENEFGGEGVFFMKRDDKLYIVADNKQRGFTLFAVNH
jgi:hypothetical protein